MQSKMQNKMHEFGLMPDSGFLEDMNQMGFDGRDGYAESLRHGFPAVTLGDFERHRRFRLRETEARA
jgi:hypothetical protein